MDSDGSASEAASSQTSDSDSDADTARHRAPSAHARGPQHRGGGDSAVPAAVPASEGEGEGEGAWRLPALGADAMHLSHDRHGGRAGDSGSETGGEEAHARTRLPALPLQLPPSGARRDSSRSDASGVAAAGDAGGSDSARAPTGSASSDSDTASSAGHSASTASSGRSSSASEGPLEEYSPRELHGEREFQARPAQT